jgi:hypothetical protein
MPTATATQPTRKLTSPRYPGWAISQTGPTDYLMTRPAGIFAIGVGHSDEHGWTGELLTMQRRSGDQTRGWEPARTPFTHSVLGCTVEADRREATIAKYTVRPLGKPTTK